LDLDELRNAVNKLDQMESATPCHVCGGGGVRSTLAVFGPGAKCWTCKGSGIERDKK